MLAGFLGRLTADSIRGLARNLFPAFYERGLSANQALLQLREVGLGYRRTDFLADYRQGRPGYDLATSVKRLNKDLVPSDNLLKSQYYGTPDKYSFVFKGSGTDLISGEDRDQFFAYHRTSLDTKANMEQDAYNWMNEQADAYGFEIGAVTLMEGYINPIWGEGV